MSADIQRTLIGTAEVPTISGGVPLSDTFHFPADWSRAESFTAWDVGKTFDIIILEGKIASRAGAAIEFGLAGPNWAGSMYVEGDISDTQICVDVSEDDFKAGIMFGVAVTLQFVLDIQTYTIHANPSWRHPFRTKKEWTSVAEIDIDSSFDLIGVIYNQIIKPWLIDGVKDIEDEIPLAILNLIVDLLKEMLAADGSPSLIASNHGIMDHVADSSIIGWNWDGLLMQPDLKIEWNLVDITVALAETIGLIPPFTAFGEAVEVLDKVTKYIRPKFQSGPMIGVVLVVHLKISGLSARVDFYDAGEKEIAGNNVRASGAELIADIDIDSSQVRDVTNVQVDFTHRCGITLETGWHFGISFVKIFSKDFIKRFRLNEFLSILELPVSEQYDYKLTNHEGNASDGASIKLVDSWILSK